MITKQWKIILEFHFFSKIINLILYFRVTPESSPIALRLFLSNESGYSLDLYTYQEVYDRESGRTVFRSYGDRQGPQHGLPITTPYVTKDHLQSKRFAAQSQSTTYVYDYPELFRQV